MPRINPGNIYLWDTWGDVFPDGHLHLVSMAADKSTPLGEQHFFAHLHLFRLHKSGWQDCGPILQPPHNTPDAPDNKSLWSGSCHRATVEVDGHQQEVQLLGYTGLRNPYHTDFSQSLMLSIVDSANPLQVTKCTQPPLFDLTLADTYHLLLTMGYALGPRANLGQGQELDQGLPTSSASEQTSSILAFRDPEIFQDPHDPQGLLHIYFGAKTFSDPDTEVPQSTPALGHYALTPKLVKTPGKQEYTPQKVQLHKPIPIPQPPHLPPITQAELPSVFQAQGKTFLLLNTTDSPREGHSPEIHVNRLAHLYEATAFDANGSIAALKYVKTYGTKLHATIGTEDYQANLYGLKPLLVLPDGTFLAQGFNINDLTQGLPPVCKLDIFDHSNTTLQPVSVAELNALVATPD
jgi:hypothetical protein